MATPLASILRPKNINEFVGQNHLMGKDGPLRKIIESGKISSMIFWGPPGCGKTTLARLIPIYVKSNFVLFSAVTGGIKDVRKIIDKAKENKIKNNQETILFVDEIHRFNKAQQDAFLPHVEDGTITLIGATTENPGFEINAPLVSRSQIYLFTKLLDKEVELILNRAINHFPKTTWSDKAKKYLVQFCDGDARKLINACEAVLKLGNNIRVREVEDVLQQKSIAYDKSSDGHYDTISAFIKSMRGSNADATLHYLARMIKAGEDPVFIARRMVIFASEDIGNTNPQALILAVSTMQAVKMIGMPESQLILSQCALYLASSKKSVAVTLALGLAMKDINNKSLDPIPLHLRNAANKVMKAFGYAEGHIRYPWLEAKNSKDKNIKEKVLSQEYMPQNLKGQKYYDLQSNSE